MVAWYAHDIIYRTLTIDLELTAKSPFRIGVGRTVSPRSPVDLQIIKISINDKDMPYIPGSSLKGVFRSTSEFIAKSQGLNVCMAGEGCRSRITTSLDTALRQRDFDGAKELLKELCILCKLYGTGSYASHITFSDAYPKSDVSIGVKAGIAIDRRSGTVKHGALYSVEFVMPSAKFYGSITLTNTPNYAIGLLAYVIDMINSGNVRIGGFKSRGFGVFEVTPINVKGYIAMEGNLKDLSEVETLNPLDEYDVEISIKEVKHDPTKFLVKFKEAWDNYVKKIRT